MILLWWALGIITGWFLHDILILEVTTRHIQAMSTRLSKLDPKSMDLKSIREFYELSGMMELHNYIDDQHTINPIGLFRRIKNED